MTIYEVWYANENSSDMEKCPTQFKSKERAQKYATTVEGHGYDTVILPWNYKTPKPKTTGKYGLGKIIARTTIRMNEQRIKKGHVFLSYPPEILTVKSAKKPKGMPKYSASLMHRCKARKR